MKSKNQKALERAMTPLRRVLLALREGISEEKFKSKFKMTCVSPGVSAGNFLRVQRISGAVITKKRHPQTKTINTSYTMKSEDKIYITAIFAVVVSILFGVSDYYIFNPQYQKIGPEMIFLTSFNCLIWLAAVSAIIALGHEIWLRTHIKKP